MRRFGLLISGPHIVLDPHVMEASTNIKVKNKLTASNGQQSLREVKTHCVKGSDVGGSFRSEDALGGQVGSRHL